MNEDLNDNAHSPVLDRDALGRAGTSGDCAPARAPFRSGAPWPQMPTLHQPRPRVATPRGSEGEGNDEGWMGAVSCAALR